MDLDSYVCLSIDWCLGTQAVAVAVALWNEEWVLIWICGLDGINSQTLSGSQIEGGR